MRTDKEYSIDIDGFQPGSVRQIVGDLNGEGLRIGVVVSRFNAAMTEALATAVRDCLVAHGVREEDIVLVWVPGAFEIPLAAQELLDAASLDALIALGVVIEGETPHAELITRTVTQALSDMSRAARVPVIDGVVATRTAEQAEVRTLTGRQSRGWYAALAAIETARVLARLHTEKL